MQDNSSIERKIAIRRLAILMLGKNPDTVIDMFAGEGVITNMLWRHVAKKVIAIESCGNKAAHIKCENVIVGNNLDYISLFSEADIIDLDAYGLVMPYVEKVPSGKIVVFTDGTPEKARKVFSAYRDFKASSDSLLRDLYFEKSSGGNAFYGVGVRA